MIKRLLYNRLMFPEPEASGGDATPAEPPAENTTAPESPPQETEAQAEANPFDFGDDDGEGEATEEQGGDNALTEEAGYSAEQLSVINEVSDKYGLDKETRAGVFKDFIERAQKLDEQEEASAKKQATETLRQKWGKDFDNNVKDAGRFINRMGKALGWKQEYIDSWKNPEDIMLAHQIYRYFGERGLKGVGEQNATAPQADIPTKEELPSRLRSLVREYQTARMHNDRETMKKASDEHMRLQSIMDGTKVRFLPV